MTRRNLELVEPLRAGARGVTLLETLDATVTPMGARLLRAWLLSPAPRRGAHRGAARRGGRAGATTPAAARGSGRRSTACATSSAWPDAPPPGAPRPASSAPCAIPSSASPTCSRALRGLARRERQRGARGHGVGEFDLLARPGGSCWRGALEERPPATLAEGGVIRRGYDAELDEMPRPPRRRQAVHRRAAAARAGAHRHPVAQGRLQQGLRVLPRGHPRAHAAGCRPTTSAARPSPAPSATSRRSSRSTRAKVLGAEERMGSREAELFGRAARPWSGGDVARIQRTAQLLARLDVWAALAESAVHGPVRAAARSRRASTSTLIAQPAPGDRADDAARGASCRTTSASARRSGCSW